MIKIKFFRALFYFIFSGQEWTMLSNFYPPPKTGWYHLFWPPFILINQEKLAWGGYIADWVSGTSKREYGGRDLHQRIKHLFILKQLLHFLLTISLGIIYFSFCLVLSISKNCFFHSHKKAINFKIWKTKQHFPRETQTNFFIQKLIII